MEMSAGKTCIRECDNLTRFDKGRNRDGGGGGGAETDKTGKTPGKRLFIVLFFIWFCFCKGD